MEQGGYEYQSDYDNVFTINDMKKKTIINALCVTCNIKHAALELGISERGLHLFMQDHNIKREHVEVMRNRFALSKIKIKLQYTPIINGANTTYRKNSEIKN